MRVGSHHRLIALFLNHLYPSSCPTCTRPTDNVTCAPFCGECWEGIKKHEGRACRVCSVPLVSEYAAVCSDCLKKRPAFSLAMSFGVYEGTLASAINIFKFGRIRRLHRPLGRLLLACETADVDAVVPVPLSSKGLRDRGFNQSLLLARVFSAERRIPLLMDGLLKKGETRPQVGLSARERAVNLKGAFATTGDFAGMRLLLIDDVMTTGATVNECSKQLLKAGAAEVVVLTLARARTD